MIFKKVIGKSDPMRKITLEKDLEGKSQGLFLFSRFSRGECYI
jgi:hypothetical protein